MRAFVQNEAVAKHPVHAEIQLLWHYEMLAPKVKPRVISSSKKACFLCNLMFQIHGVHLAPATHGRLYVKWGLPELEGHTLRQAHLRQALKKLEEVVDCQLQDMMERPRRTLPAPFESTIFPSAACSYTNRSADSGVTVCSNAAPTEAMALLNIRTIDEPRRHIFSTGFRQLQVENIAPSWLPDGQRRGMIMPRYQNSNARWLTRPYIN
ncbi:hypothetical protein M409DRAFT_61411 [Zasmidium cellare ATCC 36951]|uniref:Uncharacterized protein n=1 Tax=Zasmidium cellare ATCC 36951 TaxID=1080233 RepID=A0A6A6BVC6_ZASCE|nr:uncharacterized protein M409DRAFT_61411 [Zasmidium cellare ATCC 36951]KAF2158754.1 hypothetical protein M409DRAFT_61411 [Zasmidium cellare ATCC 36951]